MNLRVWRSSAHFLEEYSHFTSLFFFFDTLDKNKQQSAFMTEELNRTRHPDLLSSQDSANALKAQPSSIRPAACSSDVLELAALRLLWQGWPFIH